MKIKFIASVLGLGLLTSSGLSAQTINNSGFETWKDYSATYQLIPPKAVNLSIPQGWHGSDSMVTALTIMASLAGNSIPIEITPQQGIFKSDDAHTGDYAAQIFSRDFGDVGVQPSSISNANYEIDIFGMIGSGSFDPSTLMNFVQFKGGEVVDGKVESISAWLKVGDSASTDDYLISATAMKKVSNDSFTVLGQGMKTVSPASVANYTEITVPIEYLDSTATPDRLVVTIGSAEPSSTLTEYNSVKVDDVSYKLAATNIRIPLMTTNDMKVYPVPASDIVYFNLKSNVQPSDCRLVITDLSGRTISQEVLSTQTNEMNVNDWARGVYFYQLINEKTNKQQSGKFVLE